MNLDFGNDQRQPSIAAVTIKIRRVPSGMSEWLQLPDLLFMMAERMPTAGCSNSVANNTELPARMAPAGAGIPWKTPFGISRVGWRKR